MEEIRCIICKCFKGYGSLAIGARTGAAGIHGICIRHAPSQGVGWRNEEDKIPYRVFPQVCSVESCFEGIVDKRKEILFRRFGDLNYTYKDKNITERKGYKTNTETLRTYLKELDKKENNNKEKNMAFEILKENGSLLFRDFSKILKKEKSK